MKYIVDIGQVNTQIKFNTKWCITFETDLQKLFESKTDQGAAGGLPNNVDAKTNSRIDSLSSLLSI